MIFGIVVNCLCPLEGLFPTSMLSFRCVPISQLKYNEKYTWTYRHSFDTTFGRQKHVQSLTISEALSFEDYSRGTDVFS